MSCHFAGLSTHAERIARPAVWAVGEGRPQIPQIPQIRRLAGCRRLLALLPVPFPPQRSLWLPSSRMEAMYGTFYGGHVEHGAR